MTTDSERRRRRRVYLRAGLFGAVAGGLAVLAVGVIMALVKALS